MTGGREGLKGEGRGIILLVKEEEGGNKLRDDKGNEGLLLPGFMHTAVPVAGKIKLRWWVKKHAT